MVAIGLWHGISLNFLIWGIWHGVGLFVHKQWTDRTRKWYRGLNDKPAQKRAWTLVGWFITFHYVVLGWVWFALPDVEQSLHVFGGLFGIGLMKGWRFLLRVILKAAVLFVALQPDLRAARPD